MVYPLNEGLSEPRTDIQGQQAVRQLRAALEAHGLELRSLRLSGFETGRPTIFLGEVPIETGEKLAKLLELPS